MTAIPRSYRRIGWAAFVVLALTPTAAFPISVELAKQCRAMAIKAYPKALAGSLKGTAAGEREFYLRCVDRDGDIEVPPPVAAPEPGPAPRPR